MRGSHYHPPGPDPQDGSDQYAPAPRNYYHGTDSYVPRRRSRYSSRYDGDRRSRSPRERDRSPDRYNDRRSQYSDGDQRRLSGESRSNQSAFQASRDSFQREPPRGPKALLDAPSGPRGGGYAGDFRGRGRGRGRGWREESRDRGRSERDDFRDRRDGPPFRDERSRERERDWRDRERDSFRGRRPLSPAQGRGRSPPGRDFRDRQPERDTGLGVDAERARRGSRDGPLSAGSSSSDPPFGAQSYRGGFGRGRGASRGRGAEWERGRGRGGYYDDRDHRYTRSRSQESRWGRGEREERDGHRYADSDTRSRDPREDRDPRERDAARPKTDRNSLTHDGPPSTKDVSPPPIAPSAPAFGSVPSRNPSVADIQSLTGKPPPTGPRALTEERPVSAGHHGGPAAGASKSILSEGGPPIPIGPRAQQVKGQRPSSKQWINPNLAGKKIPQSPKINRSQSFVTGQPRPFGPRLESASAGQDADLSRRPRSSDAKSESQLDTTDGRLRSLHISESGDFKPGRGTQSARASVDRDSHGPFSAHGVRSGGFNNDPATYGGPTSPSLRNVASPTLPRVAVSHADAKEVHDTARASDGSGGPRRQGYQAMVLEFPVPQKQVVPSFNESSDSDDEDMDVFFDGEIKTQEEELQRLEEQDPSLPAEAYFRAGLIDHFLALRILSNPVGLTELLEPIPEGLEIPWNIPEKKPVEASAEAMDISADDGWVVINGVPPGVGNLGIVEEERQPKIEDMDLDAPHEPIPTVERDDPKPEDGDVVMDETGDGPRPGSGERLHPSITNGLYGDGKLLGLPSDFGQPSSRRTTPSQMDEDDDETEIEEVDLATLEAVRNYMNTPPIDDLPDFPVTSWLKDMTITTLCSPPSNINEFFQAKEHDRQMLKYGEGMVLRNYSERYMDYLRFTLSEDPVAKKSRDKFLGPIPEKAKQIPASITGPEPKQEGRGSGRRFASERDLERVIEASKLEEDERRERALRAQEEKFRSEKEAAIPSMYWTDEEKLNELYIDKSGFLPAEKLVAGWQVLPPIVNFTEEEMEQFEKAYLEFPKQWGRIAEQVPKRDFHACIQYYYAKKKDLNLKEKLKRQPKKKKKGTRKQRSSALVSELGNGENEIEDVHENGENGERRRPRRAAAPTFNCDTNAADSDGPAQAGTPGRRGAGASSKTDSGAEKPEVKKGRKRGPNKEKEAKQPKATQTLAPTPAAGAKPNRSRSNSRVQGPPDWQAPQASSDVGRLPITFEVPQAGMQPPIVPSQPLLSPESVVPSAPSSISEVMAPPSLRPDPPPSQASAMSNFELSQVGGTERIRAPQQASSYWSVSESNDFPALLRSFGTDWHSIANHMQTKTAVMVKNYYVRQKDGGRSEWETIASESDRRRVVGEKRPAPPAPSTGPRKRYDAPSTIHRPLAAADSMDEAGPSKAETQTPSQPPSQAFRQFQVPVPIAQAPPAPALVPVQAGAQPLRQQSPNIQPASQTMSPSSRPLRAPLPFSAFSERDREPEAVAPPAARAITQKAAPHIAPPVSEPLQPRPSAWGQSNNDAVVAVQLQSLAQKQQRQRAEQQQREEPRQPERPPMRLKPDPDVGPHYETFSQHPAARGAPPRSEPVPLARQVEQPRAVAPNPPPYAPAIQQQQQQQQQQQPPPPQQQQPPVRPILGAENIPQQITAAETRLAGMLRHGGAPPQEPYNAPAAQPVPPAVAPPPARPAERKTSNLMALLNDDPPPSSRRAPEVATPTPPPQALSARPPPVGSVPPPQHRREGENVGYSAYGRNPPSQSAMPPLKPYAPTHNQSPQAQHMAAPRGSMVSPIESAAERDYYQQRHAYPPQHQPPAANSPQTHTYPAPSQQSQIQYQPQPSAYPPPYGAPVTQPHSASPTPHYAGHPSASNRREQLPPSRETAWPPPDRGMSAQQQSHQQQTAWPTPQSHAPPPPKAPQPPQQSAWGAQHGGPPKAPPPSASMPPQQSSWPAAPPPQQGPPGGPHHMGHPRDDPRFGDPRDPRDPRAQQHAHSHSMSGSMSGRVSYPPPRGAEPPYGARYAGTPGPPEQRSYTPVGYDARRPPPQQGPGPGPGPYGAPDPREVQMRDMREREAAAQQQQQQQQQQQAQVQQGQPGQPPPGHMQRQLRPHDEYRGYR